MADKKDYAVTKNEFWIKLKNKTRTPKNVEYDCCIQKQNRKKAYDHCAISDPNLHKSVYCNPTFINTLRFL